MKKLFGHANLCHCLIKLGFTQLPQHGTRHVKFAVPKGHATPPGLRPFIIVIEGQRQYDKHTCSRYVTEIVRLGFDRQKVLDLLTD